jgi:hypothetical protein
LAEAPSLLDAINQFNYKKHAVGNAEDTLEDYRIQTTLDKAIEADCARRVTKGFPWRSPADMSQEQAQEAQKRVAQYLRYQAVIWDWETLLLSPKYRDAVMPSTPPKVVAPDVQREADLLTMLILVLNEEIRTLNGQIERYSGEWDLALLAEQEQEPEVKRKVEPVREITPEPVLPPMPETPAPQGDTCPNCGASNAEDANFCKKCGAPLRVKLAKCPKCGKEYDLADYGFCSKDGSPLT